MALIKGHNSGTNVRKMTCINPKLDLVNINAIITFGENQSICSRDIEQKRNFGVIKGYKSDTNVQKITCNNPEVDLVNMIAYIKFGENQPICFRDIERKRNFALNHEPKLWYKCAKNDV